VLTCATPSWNTDVWDGAHRHMYLALIPGHLVFFHLTSTKFGHHHHSKTVNLTDAYVYSGALAAHHNVRAATRDHAAPRRYQDGLETTDSDVDTTFVVR